MIMRLRYKGMGASARTTVLDAHVKQDEMGELNGVNRHNAALAKVALPVLVGVLVIDSVLQVIGK